MRLIKVLCLVFTAHASKVLLAAHASEQGNVIGLVLQSTFSRTVISLSKQKRMNARGHNSATSYFDDETSGAFYSRELTLPRGAMYLFPDPVTYRIAGIFQGVGGWGGQTVCGFVVE